MTGFASRQTGFTLIELLVVLTIAGLIGTVTVPMFGRVVPHYRAEAAARTLMADLRAARDQATSAGRTAAVTFEPDQGLYAAGGRSRRLGVAMAVSVDDAAAVPVGDKVILHFYADGSCDPISVALGESDRPTMIRTDWLTGRASVDEN